MLRNSFDPVNLIKRVTLWVFDPNVWWCIVFPCMEGCAMGQVLHGSATTTEAIRPLPGR